MGLTWLKFYGLTKTYQKPPRKLNTNQNKYPYLFQGKSSTFKFASFKNETNFRGGRLRWPYPNTC